MSGRRAEALEELATELRSAHAAEIEVVAGDVTDSKVRQKLLAAAESRLGGLDVLVNNAGVGAFGPFDEAEPERLRQIMEVDFFATVELTRAALPLLRAGRRPAIVNIGSILGCRGIPLAAEYCAAKFAVRGFTESLRAELHKQGISVILVSPGTTETGFYSNALEVRGVLPWRKSGRRGVSAEHVARRTALAVEYNFAEIIPSCSGKLLVLANRLFPRVMHRVMRKLA